MDIKAIKVCKLMHMCHNKQFMVLGYKKISFIVFFLMNMTVNVFMFTKRAFAASP